MTIAACVLVLVSAAYAPAGGLISDPGFESVRDDRAEGWSPYEKGYQLDETVRHGGARSIRCKNRLGDGRGAIATVVLDQKSPAPVLFSGWSKAEGVSGLEDNDYSIYVDLEFADGTPLWGQTAPFAAGTHDWQR